MCAQKTRNARLELVAKLLLVQQDPGILELPIEPVLGLPHALQHPVQVAVPRQHEHRRVRALLSSERYGVCRVGGRCRGGGRRRGGHMARVVVGDAVGELRVGEQACEVGAARLEEEQGDAGDAQLSNRRVVSCGPGRQHESDALRG